jgi:phosphatidylglycerophosphate synthase
MAWIGCSSPAAWVVDKRACLLRNGIGLAGKVKTTLDQDLRAIADTLEKGGNVTMNLPNTITLFRLVLTAIFCAAASAEGVVGYSIALGAFVFGAISDWLDGYLARKLNLVTSLGKLLDPLADKILVCSGFVYLSAKGVCPVWVTALILCREKGVRKRFDA